MFLKAAILSPIGGCVLNNLDKKPFSLKGFEMYIGAVELVAFFTGRGSAEIFSSASNSGEYPVIVAVNSLQQEQFADVMH